MFIVYCDPICVCLCDLCITCRLWATSSGCRSDHINSALMYSNPCAGSHLYLEEKEAYHKVSLSMIYITYRLSRTQNILYSFACSAKLTLNIIVIWSVCLFVCLSVHPSVCLSVCLSACPSVCPSVCLSVCLSVC